MGIAAGHGRRCITPPLGIRMVGYASRKDGAEGVHDDLFVNAVVLDDGQAPVALLAFDLCLLNMDMAEEVKRAAEDACQLPHDRVFVNTSHTHAGPTVGSYGDETDQVRAYRTSVMEQMTLALREALDDRAEAAFSAGSAPLDIGCNRREKLPDGSVILGHDPSGPTLQKVTVWRFARDDKPDIVLFSTPMHGTVLGAQNLMLSAEWMGLAVRSVEQDAPGLRAVFLQGCGADQDPYYSMVDNARGTFEEVEAHGRSAAAAVSAALDDSRPLQAVPVATLVRRVELPPKEADADALTLAMHGLRLGQAVLLGLSAEAFVGFAAFGMSVSPAAETLVLGYTDGNIGYLCTSDVYSEGGYEARTTRVGPDSERIVRDAMREMLAELAG